MADEKTTDGSANDPGQPAGVVAGAPPEEAPLPPMKGNQGPGRPPAEDPETLKSEMGKVRLSTGEARLIDRVRGAVGRGVWIREAAVLVATSTALQTLEWPRRLTDEDHKIDVGFRLTLGQARSIDQARGGVPLGTWVREAAVRVAWAIRRHTLPKSLNPLLAGTVAEAA